MNRNFKYLFKNTLQSFYKSKTCWIIFGGFVLINLIIIDFLPIFLIFPRGDSNINLYDQTWKGLFDELSWMPMILIFTIICSMTFNVSDNVYILTKSSSRFQLFLSKMLAQFLILLGFVLFYVVCWIILWAVAMQRNLSDKVLPEWKDPNIFNPSRGFTLASVIVPPILIAVCAIFLGGVFQYIFKNGINMLFAFVFGTAGLISYLTDFKVTPTNIHNQTFLYPSLVYAGLIVIGAVVSYFLINKMNIKV